MKAIGTAVLGYAARANNLEPYQAAANAQAIQPAVIDSTAHQVQVFEGPSPAMRELLVNDLWVGAAFGTADGKFKTYFRADGRTGPQPGCSINYEGDYAIGFDLGDRHEFWANCTMRDGSTGRDLVDLYTMPNGDKYVQREYSDPELPCALGDEYAEGRKYLTSQSMITIGEKCTPTMPPPTAPTPAQTARPTPEPTPTEKILNGAAIAASVVGGVVAFALGSIVYSAVQSRRQVRNERALPLRDQEGDVELGVLSDRHFAVPPPGAAPEAGNGGEPPPYSDEEGALVVHLNEPAPPAYELMPSLV